MRESLLCLFAVLLVLWLSPATYLVSGPGDSPTLQALIHEFGAVGENTQGLPPGSLDKQVSSFSTRAFEDGWAISFYFADELQDRISLPSHFWVVVSDGHRIRARRFDPADFGTHSMLHGPFGSRRELSGLGSILRIDRTEDYLIVGGHKTPSAGPSAVIRLSDMEPRLYFGGWVLQTVKGNRVVYHANMIHFAPTHPGRVRLIDLISGEDKEIYPLQPASQLWQARIRYLSEAYSKCRRKAMPHHYDPTLFNLQVSDSWYESGADILILKMNYAGSESCGLSYDDGLGHVLALYRNISTDPEAQEAPLQQILSRFEVPNLEELIQKIREVWGEEDVSLDLSH